MSIPIWYRHEGGGVEWVDNAEDSASLAAVLQDYRERFALGPGQHREGRDKLWAGRMRDEPQTATTTTPHCKKPALAAQAMACPVLVDLAHITPGDRIEVWWWMILAMAIGGFVCSAVMIMKEHRKARRANRNPFERRTP